MIALGICKLSGGFFHGLRRCPASPEKVKVEMGPFCAHGGWACLHARARSGIRGYLRLMDLNSTNCQYHLLVLYHSCHMSSVQQHDAFRSSENWLRFLDHHLLSPKVDRRLHNDKQHWHQLHCFTDLTFASGDFRSSAGASW